MKITETRRQIVQVESAISQIVCPVCHHALQVSVSGAEIFDAECKVCQSLSCTCQTTNVVESSSADSLMRQSSLCLIENPE